jgi:hypothetical protein
VDEGSDGRLVIDEDVESADAKVLSFCPTTKYLHPYSVLKKTGFFLENQRYV